MAELVSALHAGLPTAKPEYKVMPLACYYSAFYNRIRFNHFQIHNTHAYCSFIPCFEQIDVIFGDEDSRPLFIPNKPLNRKVLDTLKPMHEEWSGVPLKGALAYGLRAYRNSSNLLMHVDKALTHIISCILHIDHSEDSEPWPIIIEDFQVGDVLIEVRAYMYYGYPHSLVHICKFVLIHI